MRVVKNPQMHLGEVDISKIIFDPKSRDDMPKLLKGLQYLYTNISVRAEIFKILEEDIVPGKNKNNGRPGMELWKILVLGTIRLNLNWDYDRIHEQANSHCLIRQMLGHSSIFDKYYYELQTIKDNVRLLTPEILDKINQIVVKAGHNLLKKKDDTLLKGRCDSFVVETHVHYPTDINLLLDAMRKVIFLIASFCEEDGLTDWRQYYYNYRSLKKLMRIAQDKKRGTPRLEDKKKKKEEEIKKAHQQYIHASTLLLEKAKITLLKVETGGSLLTEIKKAEIEKFMMHAYRQISQIERRVILGEVIPHQEKVFSIFQPHTEWVVKGKAGVPVELGLKVCILEDQFQFILHHSVMQNQLDEQVAVPMAQETKKRFPSLNQISFDKGFYSLATQEALKSEIERAVLPKKGKLSQETQALESEKGFLKARRQHSAVESAINALEVHGLDRCPDHGISGFRRYVALAIVGQNIARVGAILKIKEQKKEKRKRKKYCVRLPAMKMAA
ncbi:MAG: ISNCY family transposase [Alphaproteobacteria bacterium]|nr:ISNCY family transposase [Alphaproteobacteria bacterium]